MIYRINLYIFTTTGALKHIGSVAGIPDHTIWELEDKFYQGSFPLEPELDQFDQVQEICPELYELSQKARTLTSDTCVLLTLDYQGLEDVPISLQLAPTEIHILIQVPKNGSILVSSSSESDLPIVVHAHYHEDGAVPDQLIQLCNKFVY